MTAMEDLLRAATRESAAEVLPDSIKPLDVTTLPIPSRLHRRARRSAWRFGGPLSPLYAAVAIVLVAALSVTLATVIPARRAPSSGLAGVPPYYVALTASGSPAASHPAVLTVRSTFTGAVLATVSAPAPYGTFTLVDGTADDRTFLVAARVWAPPFSADAPEPLRLFWLRYDPADRFAGLTPLPIAPLDGRWVRAASVSPDGTRVAVLTQDTRTLTDSISAYDLPGGAQRTWSVRAARPAVLPGIGVAPGDPAAIAWGADDRTISWVWSSNPQIGVYELDTAKAAGGALDVASAFAMTNWGGSVYGARFFHCDGDPFRSANGKYFLCGGYQLPGPQFVTTVPSGPVTQGFALFEPGTQLLIAIAGATTAPLRASAMPYLLWASPDASVFIGLIDGHAVVVSGGQAHPIPWPAGVVPPPGSAIPGAAW
jgi:hypothetical protein